MAARAWLPSGTMRSRLPLPRTWRVWSVWSRSLRIERFQDGPVAGAEGVAVLGHREQLFHFFHRHGLGQALGLLGRADQEHGVGGDDPALQHPLVEAAQGGDLAGHRGRAVGQPVQVGQVGAQGNGISALDFGINIDRHAVAARAGIVDLRRTVAPSLGRVLARGAGKERGILAQVGLIAPRRVRTEVPLKPEIVDELLDECTGDWHASGSFLFLCFRLSGGRRGGARFGLQNFSN